MLPRLKDFTLIELVVLALSIVLLGILVIDPFMLERSKVLMPEARKFLDFLLSSEAAPAFEAQGFSIQGKVG